MIRLPTPDPIRQEVEFDGFIVIKPSSGSEQILTNLQTISLTCLGSGAIIVEVNTVEVDVLGNL